MPFCTSCGDLFEGRGIYCALHNPYFFSKTTERITDNAYTYPEKIKYRTGRGGHHKTHKFKERDRYGDVDLDLGYDRTMDEMNGVNGMNGMNGMNDTAIIPTISGAVANQQLQATASTFSRLTSNYAINNMTISLHPSGTRSLSISANKERCQCLTCRTWFPDKRQLDMHHFELPSGCDVHGICFAREEEHYHGTSCRHDRCFVKGCTSVYRREGGWKVGVVESHIREWH